MIHSNFDRSEDPQFDDDLQNEQWRSNRKWLGLVFGAWLLLAVAMLFNTLYANW